MLDENLDARREDCGDGGEVVEALVSRQCRRNLRKTESTLRPKDRQRLDPAHAPELRSARE